MDSVDQQYAMTTLADALYTELHAEFMAHADPIRAEGVRNYFREPVQTYGMSMSILHSVARPFAQRLKQQSTLDDAFALSERLLASGWLEEGGAVEDIMRPFRKQLTPDHFPTLDRWVDHCSNWAVTDSLSCHVTGELVARHPELAPRLIPWTASTSRWRRRAACVTLVIPIRRKAAAPAAVFAVTNAVMEDRDDMVQKGAGWALRDLLVQHPAEVVEYLERWPHAGRILVRYVMEKASPDVRARFIKPRATS
jgi:3-methyladenine DNA glycosylase AlkD